MIKREISDEEIVKRVLMGETHLYESLMRKYNLRMYRISMAIVNDDMEAEDIMQTAYLNAYLQLPGFKNKSSFGTWLTRIVINESLLHKKKIQKREQIKEEIKPEMEQKETPLSNLMNKELKTILERAVSKLPEKYRLVFVMREIQEMSTNETMEILNLGESNIKIRLSRAKEMLRDELSGYYKSTQLFDFHLSRCDRIVGSVMDKIRQGDKTSVLG